MPLNDYRLERVETGQTVTMGDGSTQPETFATIYQGDRLVMRVRLNATTFCCPAPIGTGVGIGATDEQIICGVLADEHIFSGEPTYPEHHDNLA
jgi:hypothetical protein